MQPYEHIDNAATSADMPLTERVRAYLCELQERNRPITYQALARALELSPPNTIQQLTVILECLIEEDAAAGHPLIAALVISKARDGLPAPRFFDCAQRFGRMHENPVAFHAAEFDKAVAFWCRAEIEV